MMQTTMESCVPPGFRFHPTDEELVGYYLKKKIASQKIDLDVIRDIDLYRIEPWDIQERCRIGYEEQNEWYFFSHKDKKYPTGTRTNRATMAGFWKATGRDKTVYDKAKLIGMRKTLVFYKGRAPNGQKSDWIMHEYRLESEENGPPQEEGWVVCRAFKKRTTGQNKSIEGWDSAYFYDEPSSMSSVVDASVDHYISRHPPNFISQNFLCKQELEAADNLNFNHQFVQLPQLESPSLPLLKRPASSLSLLSENNEEDIDQQIIKGNNSSCSSRSIRNKQKMTDWRAMDKFVASQLMSHEEDRYDQSDVHGVSNFGENNDSDVALLLFQFQSDGGEGSEINKGFLNSSSDIGICIFDNQRG